MLTRTGKGRLLSAGYLEQAPAMDYVEPDETPVFVLTNEDRGVVVEHADERLRVRPGKGYRTIAVVTDRRLVVVVGDSSSEDSEGDQKFTVALSNVADVAVTGGRTESRLAIERHAGQRLAVFTELDGLEAVAEFVTTASQAWLQVENAMERVAHHLDDARDHRDAEDHEAALAAAEDAYETLQDPEVVARQYDEEWPGTALSGRVDEARTDCGRLVFDVRRRRARKRTNEAQAHWHREEYGPALDALEQAQEDYGVLAGIDDRYVEDRETLSEESDRVDHLLEKLREAPLRKAVQADKEATRTDNPSAAADAWTVAMDAYRRALGLDWESRERRFAGDPDAIEKRLEDVVENCIEARRAAAMEARKAGDWYVGTEEYDVAIEEFEAAQRHYEHAVSVAREAYPSVAEHLTVECEAVAERVDRTRARRDGADIEVVTEEDDAASARGDGDILAAPGGDGDGPVAPGGTADDDDDEPSESPSLELELDEEAFDGSTTQQRANQG